LQEKWGNQSVTTNIKLAEDKLKKKEVLFDVLALWLFS
jgi:hypothetical protein